MYETLILLKPDAMFSLDNMEAIVRDVANAGGRTLERQGASIVLRSSRCCLKVEYSDAPHVVEESQEIAEFYGIPCAQCSARFEMCGDDQHMELFNDHLLINERLDATGHFLIFDPTEGKLFGT